MAFLSTLSLRRATVHYDNYNLHCVISIHALLAESDKRNQGKRGQIQAISIHALLAESDNNAIRKRQIVPIISIHALLAESDAPWLARLASCSHFYPRSPCGERLVYTLIFATPMLFLSTLSLRRATPVRDVIQWEGIFLSTLSLRRATASDSLSDTSDVISIHALLAESDASKRAQQPKQPNFYPRSPCGERRLIRSLSIMLFDFYPRSPCGERPADTCSFTVCQYFYPRSPCGERPTTTPPWPGMTRISIHALLAESDLIAATSNPETGISIHALLAESDRRVQQVRQVRLGISIHALLAESDILGNVVAGLHMSFLSTLSLRRATL